MTKSKKKKVYNNIYISQSKQIQMYSVLFIYTSYYMLHAM